MNWKIKPKQINALAILGKLNSKTFHNPKYTSQKEEPKTILSQSHRNIVFVRRDVTSF